MQFRCRVYGQADLDGAHRAVLETDRVPPKPVTEPSETVPYVRLEAAGRACGCILTDIKPSDQTLLRLDRFKLITLKLKDGDTVDVDFLQPPPAERVRLMLPSDFLRRDMARLIGKPLVKGEKTPVFTLSGEPRIIQVADTKPAGIVVLGAATEIVVSDSAENCDDDVPVTYADIGGLSREIKTVRELIEYPIRFPDLFEYLGTAPPKGIVLCGPPGTGKTLLVRALLHEVGARFYYINGPEIIGKWYGESESRLREIFEEARKNTPALILIDELDAIAPKRDQVHGEVERRVVATLLTLMDGLNRQRGIVVVGTTNRPNAIDGALRRQGRYGHEIHIGVPDIEGRRQILQIHTRRMPLAGDVVLDALAEKCAGYVGADIASLCREAAYNTVRRSFSEEQLKRVISPGNTS